MVVSARGSRCKPSQYIVENEILRVKVAHSPTQMAIPITSAGKERLGRKAIADLTNDRLTLGPNKKIECQALGTQSGRHSKRNLQTLQRHPLTVIHDPPAAGCPEISGAILAQKAKCTIPDDGDTDIVPRLNNIVLEIHIPLLSPQTGIDPADLAQVVTYPSQLRRDAGDLA